MIQTKECKECGKIFGKKLVTSPANWKKREYCSQDCFRNSRRKRIEKECLYCRKEFVVSFYRKELARYCSCSCKAKFQMEDEEMAQKIHQGWKKWWSNPQNRKRMSEVLMGRKSWLKGKHHTQEMKERISRTKKGKVFGDKIANWLGDRVGYSGLHYWVGRWKGKPALCVDCGIKGSYYTYYRGDKPIMRWNIEWSNIDGKYRRKLEDYIGRCIPCHRKYDYKQLKLKG